MAKVVFSMLLVLSLCPAARAGRGPEVIDPQKAKADPDFAIQGEYAGEGLLPDGKKSKAGAQVIALGEGTFRAVLYRGGLPGAGWRRGGDRFTLEGKRQGNAAVFTSPKAAGRIEKGALAITTPDGKPLVEMRRTERTSPTLGEKPPAGAVVLFDGTSADAFKDGKLTAMKTLDAGTTTKSRYKIARLHLEFRLSWMPKARGQGRSNSGVYITGLPEIQVLDSFGLEGKSNECGGFYGRRDPEVNMCLPPLVWQTYDVEFPQPKRDSQGRPTENIRATVRHNGVVVQANHATGQKDPPQRSIHLQRHGNRVQYRNIWLVEPK